MGELIERVAKRMASINCPRSWDEGGPSPMSAAEKDVHRTLARAAIEAMRDHTEAMLDAGTASLWPPNDYLPGSAAVAAYRAMIDAALQEH